jgi:hypothetical protein
MQLPVAEESHAGKLPCFRFRILDELLKELVYQLRVLRYGILTSDARLEPQR